jgi:hypothetical protein
MVHRPDQGRPGLRGPGRAGGRGTAGGRSRAWPAVGGPDPGQQDPSPQGAAARLGGDKAGNWQRWHKENIPVAGQLYLDYTTRAEE